MSGRIVIVDDEPITRMDIRGILEDKGYNVVGEASDGITAVELCKELRPDLVLMDISMPILNGLKASKLILEKKYARSVILCTAYSDSEHINKAKEYGVSGFVVKPIDERHLIPTIEVGMAMGNKQQMIEKKHAQLEKKLNERKIIEKAKGILMKEQQLDEEEAYNLLRNISMNKRCQIIEIAEMLVVKT